MTLKQNPTEEFDIIEHLGTVSERIKGNYIHRKELNIISFNGGRPVYDLRTWIIKKSNRTKFTMDEGIKLSKAEIKTLMRIIEKEVFPNE